LIAAKNAKFSDYHVDDEPIDLIIRLNGNYFSDYSVSDFIIAAVRNAVDTYPSIVRIFFGVFGCGGLRSGWDELFEQRCVRGREAGGFEQLSEEALAGVQPSCRFFQDGRQREVGDMQPE